MLEVIMRKKLIAAALSFAIILSLSLSAFAAPNLDSPSDWAIEYVEETIRLGIHPEIPDVGYRDAISRAQFCTLGVTLFEHVTGIEIAGRVQFSDTGDVDVQKMAWLSIVQGHGDGTFGPDALLTREQAAIILTKLAGALGCTLKSAPLTFADKPEISSWALDYVASVTAQGIMLGVGGGRFDPQGIYTFEQSLITILRVYNLSMGIETPVPPAPDPLPDPVPDPKPPAIGITHPSLAGRRIPILMYHSVLETPTTALTDLFVRPNEMEQQLIYLRDNGYDTIFFDDLDHISDYDKPILLTFDDGYRDNYTNLFPLLQKYNMKATIFMISDAIYSNSFVTAEMLREMSDSGLVSIQSHTVSHIELGFQSSETEIRRQLLNSKHVLEAITGKSITTIAYPNGSSNALTRSIVPDYYKYALNKDGGHFVCGQNLFTMNRIRISRDTTISRFATLIS